MLSNLLSAKQSASRSSSPRNPEIQLPQGQQITAAAAISSSTLSTDAAAPEPSEAGRMAREAVLEMIAAAAAAATTSSASPGSKSKSIKGLFHNRDKEENDNNDTAASVLEKESMDTLLAHAGVARELHNAPMSPPLCFATTYTRPEDGVFQSHDFVYSRAGNPTRDLLETEIARLETYGGKPIPNDNNNNNAPKEVPTCCAFASGMMAVTSIILSHIAPVHLILPKDLYHGVLTVSVDVFSRFQCSIEQVDMTDLSAIQDALKQQPDHTDIIVWIETPSNPLCLITDIEEVCRITRLSAQKCVTVVVDSTLSPPIITQPLLLGADLVMHSATKYLAGHSDALVGVVTASPWTERGRAIAPRLRQTQISTGGVAAVMDSWLTLRGLRTLSVRVQRQCATALKVAEFLNRHDSVVSVHYPGLTTHSQYPIAQQQMKHGLFGGLLSLELSTEARAMALAGALQTIQRATSLGGTETLIEHRASIEPKERRISPLGLLRVSIGLEDPDDLIRDFTCALKIVDQIVPYRRTASAQERSDWKKMLGNEITDSF